MDALGRRRDAARLADPLSARRGRADAADDGAAPALPRALADATRRPALERRPRRAALGARLPVRRRAAALLGALHALGGAVRALAVEPRLDPGQRRRAPGDAAGRVRLRPHARRVAGEPGPRLRVLGARRAPLAHAVSPDERADANGALIHGVCRRPRGRRGGDPTATARRAHAGHRLPRAEPALPHRPSRAAQASHRRDRRPSCARTRSADRHLDADRRHQVRRRVVRVPGQRALRDRHRERLQCA